MHGKYSTTNGRLPAGVFVLLTYPLTTFVLAHFTANFFVRDSEMLFVALKGNSSRVVTIPVNFGNVHLGLHRFAGALGDPATSQQ